MKRCNKETTLDGMSGWNFYEKKRIIPSKKEETVNSKNVWICVTGSIEFKGKFDFVTLVGSV